MPDNRLVTCHLCDWVARVPELGARQVAACPRCRTRLSGGAHGDGQHTLAWASATLVMLAMALSFPFLWFEVRGIENGMRLFDAVLAPAADDYAFVAVLVALTTVVLPVVYLGAMLYVSFSVSLDRELPGARAAAHVFRPVQPWLMSDVFIVGVLISLIKIVTMADISAGPSFFAFCAYAVLMLHTVSTFDRDLFWRRFANPAPVPFRLQPGRTAASQGVVDCASCGLPMERHRQLVCPCCGLKQQHPMGDRLQATWALLATAVILLVPANVLPIMQTVSLGYDAPATIIGGVRHLVETGSWPIALVIFVASIVVPIGKILALGWLCHTVRAGRSRNPRTRMRLYRITEFVGRWSMIDVFVVAVLTALIQGGRFMAVHPGPAAAAFAGAVVLTMLAAITFDPREIWREDEFNGVPA